MSAASNLITVAIIVADGALALAALKAKLAGRNDSAAI
jgi:hypothetical protein